MSLSKRTLLLTALLVAIVAIAPAATIGFVPPLPVTCPLQTWGCETSGTPTFGSGSMWQVTSGNIDLVQVPTYWTGLTSPGGWVIDLSGSERGSMATTLTGLMPGMLYALTFEYTINPDDSVNEPRAASVAAPGASLNLGPIMNFTNAIYGPGNDLSDASWQTASLQFTVPGSGNATITFTSLDNQFQGIVLRNTVDVSPVPVPTPEPASIAFVGLGLGLVGLKRFRRA